MVVCLEVLEHVSDPVQAIRELSRVVRRQLIISVPHEPYFTLWRGHWWEREHLWAITPALLALHLGPPQLAKNIFLSRYHVGVWDMTSRGSHRESVRVGR